MVRPEDEQAQVRRILHDLNNCLGIIQNYAAFLAEGAGDDPGIGEDVAEIQAASRRAVELARELGLVLRPRGPSAPADGRAGEQVADATE